MFSFIKGLFGSSKNTDTVVETAAKGIYNGLDAMFFTEEEKAQYRQQQADAVLEFAKVAYDQNSIRSITRRWLAFMVVAPTMLAFVIGVTLSCIGAFVDNPGSFRQAAEYLYGLVSEVSPWSIGILVFYFGPHLISALPRKSSGA